MTPDSGPPSSTRPPMRPSSGPAAGGPVATGKGPARLQRPLLRYGLLALLVLWFLVGLGGIPLLDPDEPYYAVPAREMLRSGSWLVPLFHGQPWFDKPVLYYWTILGAYKLFGVSEFSARLGSALSGLGGTLLLLWLTVRLGLSRRVAFLSAVVLATTIEYVVLARGAVTDMMLTFLLTAGMLFAACGVRERRWMWSAAAGAALGLATLTKGPVGPLVAAVALVGYGLLAGRGRRPRLGHLAVMGVTTGAVAAPWYLWVTVAYPELLKGFVEKGNLERFLHPEHPSSWLFYPVMLAFGLFPWAGGLPGALWSAVRGGRRTEGPPADGAFDAGLYALCWTAAIVCVFQLSASKLPSYVLPAFPPLAILLGTYWDRLPERPLSWRRVASPQWAAALGLAAGAIMSAALVTEAFWFSTEEPLTLWIAALIILGGPAAAWVAVRRRSLPVFLSSQVVTSLCLALVLLLVVAPVTAEHHSTAGLIRKLEERGLADQVTGAYGVEESFSLEFYLDRPFVRIDRPERLRPAVSRTPGEVWFVRTTDLASLEGLGLGVELVEEGERISAVRLEPSESAEEGAPPAGAELPPGP